MSRKGLLARLARPFSALGRLVAGGDEEVPAAVREASEASDGIVEDSFTLALDTLLTEDEGKFHTRLQVISLVEFREAVGDKWFRLSEKVMMIAEGVINLHLGAGNVFGRRGQDLFVLLFRNLSAAEGRRRAVQIAQELGTRLVGAQFIGNERPLALAAEITLGDAIGPDGALDLAALHDAVGEMRAIIAPHRPGPERIPPPCDRTSGRGQSADPPFRAAAAAARAGGPAGPSAPQQAGGQGFRPSALHAAQPDAGGPDRPYAPAGGGPGLDGGGHG